MAVPTAYTESTLATYMVTVLGETATVLGLTSSDFTESVYETALEYGAEIASATSIRKLRALARVQAWKHAMSVSAGRFHFSADGGNYNREQIFDHIKTQYAQAMREAAQYSQDYHIKIGQVDFTEDPYEFYEVGDRNDMRSGNAYNR